MKKAFIFLLITNHIGFFTNYVLYHWGILKSVTTVNPRAQSGYGLMSKTGVPSSASRPFTHKTFSFRVINSTRVNPRGLGWMGVLVAKTPTGRFNLERNIDIEDSNPRFTRD